jgi:uncharacterized protein YkwD
MMARLFLVMSAVIIALSQTSEARIWRNAVRSNGANVESGANTTAANQTEPSPSAADNAKQEEATPSETADGPAKTVDGLKLAAIEANIVAYTNEERAKYGLPALEVDKELMESAREHAAWMTRNQAMVHTSQPVAENIAMGQPHSSDTVSAWMGSSGHRANILNPAHGRIGVAAYRAASGAIFWCQQFRPGREKQDR